jgi:hypothetical protein
LTRHRPILAARFLGFGPGTIYDRLLGALSEEDPLILVDISKINANVCFELGLSLGLNRPGFPVIETNHRVYSDLLRGLFYVPYKLRRPLGEDFLSGVRRAWAAYQLRRGEVDFVHMLSWRHQNRAELTNPYIVGIGHNELKDDKAYRRAIRAGAERSALDVKYIWGDENKLLLHPEAGAGTVLTSVYTLLRQARGVVARVEDIRTEHRASQFVAIGIAKGLEEKFGHPRVLLCYRQKSPEGRDVNIPSDLDGLRNTAIFDAERPQQISSTLAALLGNAVQAEDAEALARGPANGADSRPAPAVGRRRGSATRRSPTGQGR